MGDAAAAAAAGGAATAAAGDAAAAAAAGPDRRPPAMAAVLTEIERPFCARVVRLIHSHLGVNREGSVESGGMIHSNYPYRDAYREGSFEWFSHLGLPRLSVALRPLYPSLPPSLPPLPPFPTPSLYQVLIHIIYIYIMYVCMYI